MRVENVCGPTLAGLTLRQRTDSAADSKLFAQQMTQNYQGRIGGPAVRVCCDSNILEQGAAGLGAAPRINGHCPAAS